MLQNIISVFSKLEVPRKAGEQSNGNSQFEAKVQWERLPTAKNS